MNRLSRQDGMTLPELLTALTIAMIISLATFALVETVMTRAGEVGTRVDTTQRARHAMDLITRQLRSQVCVKSTSPSTDDDARAIYAATPTSVTFFVDLSDQSHHAGSTTLAAPELRTISYEDGELWERRWVGVQTPNTDLDPIHTFAGFPGAPSGSYQLAEDVTTLDGAADTPIFRYFMYDDSSPPTLVPMTPPSGGITAAQAALIAEVRMSFRAHRTQGKSNSRGFTVLENTVFARHADANSPIPDPVCA